MKYQELTELRKSFDDGLKQLTNYAVVAKKSGYIYGLFSYKDSAQVFVNGSQTQDFYDIMDMETGEVC